ncbi:MAG: 23S rRNA (pseudouridine(1915)-N(3))-methyltransferase RlmH [Planctomycetota bacterium]
MKLRILTIGKLRDEGLERYVDEFVRRSRAFLPIEVVVMRDAESAIERSIQPRVVLDERGEQIESPQLAAWLRKWRDGGVRQVDFLIGDAHGFAPSVRDGADRVLALSRLTLPHRLAAVLLVEQLYRAGTILAGHPYHHE